MRRHGPARQGQNARWQSARGARRTSAGPVLPSWAPRGAMAPAPAIRTDRVDGLGPGGEVIMDSTEWPSRLSFDVESLPTKLCPVERTELPSSPAPAERARGPARFRREIDVIVSAGTEDNPAQSRHRVGEGACDPGIGGSHANRARSIARHGRPVPRPLAARTHVTAIRPTTRVGDAFVERRTREAGCASGTDAGGRHR